MDEYKDEKQIVDHDIISLFNSYENSVVVSDITVKQPNPRNKDKLVDYVQLAELFTDINANIPAINKNLRLLRTYSNYALFEYQLSFLESGLPTVFVENLLNEPIGQSLLSVISNFSCLNDKSYITNLLDAGIINVLCEFVLGNQSIPSTFNLPSFLNQSLNILVNICIDFPQTKPMFFNSFDFTFLERNIQDDNSIFQHKLLLKMLYAIARTQVQEILGPEHIKILFEISWNIFGKMIKEEPALLLNFIASLSQIITEETSYFHFIQDIKEIVANEMDMMNYLLDMISANNKKILIPLFYIYYNFIQCDCQFMSQILPRVVQLIGSGEIKVAQMAAFNFFMFLKQDKDILYYSGFVEQDPSMSIMSIFKTIKKYLNSEDSPYDMKRSLLYALYIIIKTCDEDLLNDMLYEGLMALLMPFFDQDDINIQIGLIKTINYIIETTKKPGEIIEAIEEEGNKDFIEEMISSQNEKLRMLATNFIQTYFQDE